MNELDLNFSLVAALVLGIGFLGLVLGLILKKNKKPKKEGVVVAAPEMNQGTGENPNPDDGLEKKLVRSRNGLWGKFKKVLASGSGQELSEDILEEIEQVLFSSDMGFQSADHLLSKIRSNKSLDRGNLDEIKEFLKSEILNMLDLGLEGLEKNNDELEVILFVGVNGVGKTTTIGKLAQKFKNKNKKVLLGAGDTFRAAAGEQLEIWANRSGVDILRKEEGSDPASVLFDAIKEAQNKKCDLVLCDSAGRLHTKNNLMDELKKIHKVIGKACPGAPHEVYLVLDATTGQNGLAQAREFMAVAGVSGVVLTKLDGTAKGGIVLAISNEFKLPIKYIGVGEGVEDLREFNAEEFVDALFES